MNLNELVNAWDSVLLAVRRYKSLEDQEVSTRNVLINGTKMSVRPTHFASIDEYAKWERESSANEKLMRDLRAQQAEIVDEITAIERKMADILPHNIWFKCDETAFGISDYAGFCTDSWHDDLPDLAALGDD